MSDTSTTRPGSAADAAEPTVEHDITQGPLQVAPSGSGNALRAAVVFSVGNALQRGIAFLLLPVYTHALAPAEYGVLSVFLAISSAAAILFALGLDLAIFRSFFQLSSQPARQRQFIGSIWRFLIGFPVLAALLIGAIGWPLAANVRHADGLDLLLALLCGATFVASTIVPLAVMRIGYRLVGFAVLTGVGALVNATLTVVLVVVLSAGVKGWLLATLAANCMMLVVAIALVPWDRTVRYDRALVRRAVTFGLTLVPHAFSQWALLLADRLVLAGLVSASALGVYSLAANLGVPVMIGVQSLNQALMPSYAKAGADAGARAELEGVVLLEVVGVTLLCLAGALLGPPLVGLMAAPAYRGAASLVPWIALGYGFLGFYFIPMNGVTLGAGRSSLVWLASGLSAAANIALLYLFVPSGGIRAAAIASAAGYLVLLVTISIYARGPDNPVQFPWRKAVVAVVTALAAFLIADLALPEFGVAAFATRLGILAGSVLVLFLSGILALPRRSLGARRSTAPV